MPYVNKPRPYKKEYEQQKARKENPARAKRAAARRKWDKDNPGKSRKGKDLGHRVALKNGGDNEDGVRLESRSRNRAKGGASSKPPKRKKSKK